MATGLEVIEVPRVGMHGELASLHALRGDGLGQQPLGQTGGLR
jgi:hypothetical protein